MNDDDSTGIKCVLLSCTNVNDDDRHWNKGNYPNNYTIRLGLIMGS